MQLKQCDVQLMLLGPAALTRPWIYFEAGGVWSQEAKPQIPICHSGLQPARLPIPLSLLQGGLLTDASFWQSVFKTIAKSAESRVPKVDFQGLSDALALLASRVTQATSTTRPQDALARVAGPELRALSPDRQRLEQHLYGAILRYTTLRAQHRAADPSLIEPASNASGLFWGNPTSFSDQEVARALDTLNAAIAALEGVDLRLEVLRELRNINRRQARTNVILGFGIAAVANRLALEAELVQDTLTDVLGEGLAEPYAATFGQAAEAGACRITEAGMRELRRLEAAP